jgi:opacity protein-like surface antigen
MKKIIIPIVALFGLLSTSKAQFDISNLSLGVGLAPSYYFAVGEVMVVSPLIKGQYEGENEDFYGLDFSRPKFSTTQTDGNGLTWEESITYLNFNAHYGKYLIGDADESFNVYGRGGVGYTMYSITSDNGTADESDDDFTINLGVGANIGLTDNIKLFAEPVWIFAAGTYNSRSGSTATYGLGNVSLNIGAKYRFN